MTGPQWQSSALLFANGIFTPGEAVRRVLATQRSATIVCADGGALHARALGLQPQIIIGDMDSLSALDVVAFGAAGAQIIQHPPEKDETDLELALHLCHERGVQSVTILGGLGGRFDQTLANILLLTLPMLASMRIELVDGAQVIRLLPAGVHQIIGAVDDTVSLIPLQGAATGITTRGLQYALRNETLPLGPARGISNVMLAEQAEIELGGGLLLLVHTIGRARPFTIIKRDAASQETLRYSGFLHQQTAEFVCIDATFELADRDLGYIQLRRGDHFREWFFIGRWYNIFRVGDAHSGALKGWYCNITRPPSLAGEQIVADDLCLDLFVYPDGRVLLLDEDEFAQLAIAPEERAAAWRAVAELRQMIARCQPPFDEINATIRGRGGSPAPAHSHRA